MKNLIKQILKETINTKVVNLVLDRLNSNRIKPPYFKNLEDLGLSEEEIKLILGEFTKGKVDLTDKAIYDKRHGTDIYNEWGDGEWAIREYNKFGGITKIVESEGYWENRKYDERGNEIYREDSNGFWYKQEWDDNDNEIYFENSNGRWVKYQYNENGNLIYQESNEGVIIDKR
jgi:YD repeat-containing protein